MATRARARSRPEPVAELSWDQVLGLRLRRQRLDARAPHAERLAVAGALCGLHAQLMSSAELTLWARVEQLAADDVATALWEERTLVKTWAARGTLHLLPSADYGSWTGALSARAPRAYLNASRLRYFGLTEDELLRIAAEVDATLADGRLLTRTELAAEVQRRTGSEALGDRLRDNWGSTLKYPAAIGALCFGPSDGQSVRFTHPTAWLGAWEAAAGEPALADAARRWLAAAGPLTRDELARWWGVAPADGRRMLRLLGDEVVPVSVAGEERWLLAADVEPAQGSAAKGSGVVRLLPAFDQYTIAATRHAERLLPADARARVYRPQGWISPVLLVEGRMAGVWRHERRGAALRVGIEPFGRLSAKARTATAGEVERLARFLGGEPALAWGPLD